MLQGLQASPAGVKSLQAVLDEYLTLTAGAARRKALAARDPALAEMLALLDRHAGATAAASPVAGPRARQPPPKRPWPQATIGSQQQVRQQAPPVAAEVAVLPAPNGQHRASKRFAASQQSTRQPLAAQMRGSAAATASGAAAQQPMRMMRPAGIARCARLPQAATIAAETACGGADVAARAVAGRSGSARRAQHAAAHHKP